MPIISSIKSTSQTVPQKTDLKPIGICLPTNTSIEMSNSGATLATNRVATTTSTTGYRSEIFNTNASQSSTPQTPLPVGALSVMVARFSDNNSRPQTVILHPRTISTAPRGGLQVNTIRGQSVITGQSISTTGSTPSLTSTSASISVRTTQLISGQQPTNSLPVLNLSTNVNTSAVTQNSVTNVKQICGQNRPLFTTSGPLPIESVSLVMAPNDHNVMSARPIRLQTNDLKQNITKISGPRTTLMAGSTIMATHPQKVAISIGGTGPQTGTAVSQPVARVGIIGQLPVPTTTVNKSGIINLHKGHLIINSASGANMNTGSTTLHNIVNVSGGSITSFTTTAQSSPQTAKLSLNSSPNNILTTRHSVVSTSSPFIHSVSNSLQSSQQQHIHTSQQRTIGHQNANSLQTSSTLQPQQLLPPITSVNTTSPLRPTILSSPANSPIKQSLQTSTPSSPRPSILIRKRPNDLLSGGLTPTALFKTTVPNTSISGSTIPRVSCYGLKTDLLNSENKVNDLLATSDANLAPNCSTAHPTTPNSEGNQTPRKKPRKQLLEPSSLKTSQNLNLLNSSTSDCKEDICNEKESVVRINKKPRVSLLSSYNMGWKSLQYHFLRYSDVRPKPEKKLTLSELSNEGLQRKNGWKIHHLASQMEVMTDNEHNVYQRLNQFLETFEKDVCVTNNQCSNTTVNTNTTSTPNATNCLSASESNNRTTIGVNEAPLDTIAVKLNDLIRGNLQRSNLFSDQITEAKQLIIKLTTDHKERVGKITKKCANKRTYINK